MTVTEIVVALGVKQFCISDFVHDTLACDDGVISDEVVKAKIDAMLFAVACECLERTNIYFLENNPEEEIDEV